MTKKKERKERDPRDFMSSKYPLLHTLRGTEKQEFWIEDAGCNYGTCMNNLRKNWLGYKIAKSQDDYDSRLDYAARIQDIQRAIGFKVTTFIDLPHNLSSGASPYDDI